MSETAQWAASMSNSMHSSDGLNITLLVYGLLIAGAIFWVAWGLARKAISRQETEKEQDLASKRLRRHPALSVAMLMIFALFAGALIGIGMDSIKADRSTSAGPNLENPNLLA